MASDSLALRYASGRHSALTNWSFEQLAGIAAAPPKYLRTLPAAIASDAINHGLRRQGRNQQQLLHDLDDPWTVDDHDSVRYCNPQPFYHSGVIPSGNYEFTISAPSLFTAPQPQWVYVSPSGTDVWIPLRPAGVSGGSGPGGETVYIPDGNAPVIATATTVPAAPRIGESVTTSWTLRNQGSSSLLGTIVDLEIYRDSQKVAQQIHQNVSFQPGETRTFSFPFTPDSQSSYVLKVGIFDAGWRLYRWLDSVLTVHAGAAPSSSAALSVWWPMDGAVVSGLQPLKARLEGVALSDYVMTWQVDGGVTNGMWNVFDDAPHKQGAADMSIWTWRGSAPRYGPYQITFTATSLSGQAIGTKSVTIHVVP